MRPSVLSADFSAFRTALLGAGRHGQHRVAFAVIGGHVTSRTVREGAAFRPRRPVFSRVWPARCVRNDRVCFNSVGRWCMARPRDAPCTSVAVSTTSPRPARQSDPRRTTVYRAMWPKVEPSSLTSCAKIRLSLQPACVTTRTETSPCWPQTPTGLSSAHSD